MEKPSDFLVGITDLFSVILPGGLLTYMLMLVETHQNIDLLQLRTLGNSTAGYIAFFAAAYILGNLTDLIGSIPEDYLYGILFLPLRRWFNRRPNTHPSLLNQVTELTKGSCPEGESVYQWCRTWVQIMSPSAYSEIERLQANSKFFRGFFVVSIVAACFSDCLLPDIPYWGRILVLTTLIGLAFFRFSDLRWKATQQAYRGYIALHQMPAPPPPGAAA